MSSPLSLPGLLETFQPAEGSPHSLAVQRAVHITRALQNRANHLQTPSERRQQAELDRMLQHPADKATLSQITDQSFRANNPRRAVGQLIHILDVQGIPRFFTALDRALLQGFRSFGGYAPGVALPLVREHMQKETANVILPGEREILTRHLRERTRAGVRMNVNFLGEAILGEGEAERRLQQYLQALQWPEIEVVSIKISTLYSQINPLAREHTLRQLSDRIERLCRTAAHMTFTRPDGTQARKFAYLDMEEYRDMSLTSEAFMRTLDRPGMESVEAGIALQSYIPDSHRTLLTLLEWARHRAQQGRAPITIRLVKGANMEMERVEASLRGWPQAPYREKRETDANFKRMLHELMRPENLAAIRVGVASHNLFDLAYGLVLAQEADAIDKTQFEMLEGMANHQRRALAELCPNLLLYAPACRRENFVSAIGYLVRRLDENTGSENFLRHAFKLTVGSREWQTLERGFLDSFLALPTTSEAPRRTQDRHLPPPASSPAIAQGWSKFVNEPDTDFSLPANGRWGEELVARWIERRDAQATLVPIVIAGDTLQPPQPSASSRNDARPRRDCLDPSRPGVVVGRYYEAAAREIDQALACAAADPDSWRSLPARERFDRLGRVAQELRAARADLMGAALAHTGKTLLESDPEVSEAVDFVEFYRDTARYWQELPHLKAHPKGVVVVVPPWNFPIAIPCGGIAAALAAGNTVILKPASDAVLPAYFLCECFWRAGISKKILQFVPCPGDPGGQRLVNDPRSNAVILTGGTATALAMLQANPRLQLSAETGGKNATIVTALADRDQAIKHVIHSAFSHGGQKCSATSLLLLEADVYDDPQFRAALVDAVASIEVGSAWDLSTRMGPLIRPPKGELEDALKVLEPGEEWALMPQEDETNAHLWTPGIKYGVRPGSVTHTTEFFGPVLGVMRFRALDEAIDLVNQTGYGLTSGLESLDEREWETWKAHIRAGNLYINRATTGAIVLRQPFGGMGKSAFGPGIKAGGPNYVSLFMSFSDADAAATDGTCENNLVAQLCRDLQHHVASGSEPKVVTTDLPRLTAAALSYDRNYREEFGRTHDHFLLVGEDNQRRYLPIRQIHIRTHPQDSLFDLFGRVCAARIAGCHIVISSPPAASPPTIALLELLTLHWAAAIEFIEESDEDLAKLVRSGLVPRLRYASPDRVPDIVQHAASETGRFIASAPVLAHGRAELSWYFEEQSLSVDYHRYGNLGARVTEPRSPVL